MSSKNAQNKLEYVYILAPSGMNLKKELTLAFDAQAGQIWGAEERNQGTAEVSSAVTALGELRR